MLIIINCFTVSVTFLILQILSKSSTRMVMKVFEMGKRWALYRQKAIHQVLLLFTVKAVPVLPNFGHRLCY
jgi:hypothetical protein